jgi:hypothetical protein
MYKAKPTYEKNPITGRANRKLTIIYL